MAAIINNMSATENTIATSNFNMSVLNPSAGMIGSNMPATRNIMSASGTKTKMAATENIMAPMENACCATASDICSVARSPALSSARVQQPLSLPFKETISPVGCPLASMDTISHCSDDHTTDLECMMRLNENEQIVKRKYFDTTVNCTDARLMGIPSDDALMASAL